MLVLNKKQVGKAIGIGGVEMGNNCPNCNRRYGIEMKGELDLTDIGHGLYLRYHCGACNAHWLRPKKEMEIERKRF